MALSSRTAPLFPEEDTTLPPTWTEDAEVFHTVAQCSRLQTIPRNRRITGKPPIKLRPCFTCEDIVRTKRRG